MEKCEQKVENYEAYSKSLCAARDWIHTSSGQMTANSDTSGDLPSLTSRLQCISELVQLMPEGRVKVEACVTAAAVVSSDCEGSSLWSIHADVDELQKMLKQLENDANDAQGRLQDTVEQWNAYEEHCQVLDEWLKNMEKSVKQKVMVSSADEIKPLAKSFQVTHVINNEFNPLTVYDNKNISLSNGFKLLLICYSTYCH